MKKAIETIKKMACSMMKKASMVIGLFIDLPRMAASRKEYEAMRKANNLPSYASLAKDDRFITMSHGNKKLNDSKETAFLIWNLPAVVTCPYRTAMCEKLCYAKKAETVYKDALPARYRNLEMSKEDDFIDRMIYTIETEYASFRRWDLNKTLVVRVHESGDFYNKVYAMKWLSIAKHFQDKGYKVKFMAYTKSLCFFENENVPDNFIIRASIWCDTTPENEAVAWNYPVYTAYDVHGINDIDNVYGLKIVEETDPAIGCEWLFCRCEDCGTCNACWNRKYKNIVCKIH